MVHEYSAAAMPMRVEQGASLCGRLARKFAVNDDVASVISDAYQSLPEGITNETLAVINAQQQKRLFGLISGLDVKNISSR